MATARKPNTRRWIYGALAAAFLALLIWSFMPRPVPVDFGSVTRASMSVTIDEEARTRVRDAYVVSAPIAGRLLRVEVEPGDEVMGGETVIARMLAAPPSAIDLRTREQARAGVSAAEAGLRVARADLNSALASQDLADADLARTRTLFAADTVAQAALDQAKREKRAADAAVDTAKAAISMREAELANARARLISFDNRAEDALSDAALGDTIPLTAPIAGRVLRVVQESETTVAAGAPILEIGDVNNDLEVICELLSTDAVQVSPGDSVIIDNWGGRQPLHGMVERVEPWGFTKFSALGVEEQRVNTIIRFSDPLEDRLSLGHGYRVEARIVIWQDDDALTVPASALFRREGNWATFVVENGRVRETVVDVVQSNGITAAIASGLQENARVVLYPGPEIHDGGRVEAR